ncbi:MAG: cytochrome c oxidase subunit II [Bdellovibrionales bacterium]|nr:cytochrome c oxidase subunit II [Bdellovibrionales bacterium]
MDALLRLTLSVAYADTFAPPEGTHIARQWDSLYSFILWASLIASVMVVAGMIYFALKYKRRSDNDTTAYITHNNTLEFLWSFIPFVFFLIMFGWGWKVYHEMRNAPKGAFEIHVTGQKWNWTFDYKSGKKTDAEFVVPVNTDIKLIMTSKDVIHSFYIPAFRIKQDVVPGRYTSLWFNADKIGDFQIFCTEYCGTGHSAMLAKVKVVEKEKFEEWLANDPYKGLSLVEVGKKVFDGKCTACHNITTEKKVGPGFFGLFGKSRSFADGSSTTADENYIRESVLKPNSKVVQGFPAGVMPTFAGQIADNEIRGVIEYIKTLK